MAFRIDNPVSRKVRQDFLNRDTMDIKVANISDLNVTGAISLTGDLDITGDVNLVSSTDGDYTTISATVDPTSEDPILELNGGIAGRGSHIKSTQNTAPTVAGTGQFSTLPTLTNATDMAGRVNFTDAGVGAGTVTITFNQPYGTVPAVVITPAVADLTINTTATVGIGYYVITTTTGFTFNATGTGGGANTLYYHVIEAV